MGTKRMYSVSVIPDKEGEIFSQSFCNCEQCRIMHAAQLEWDSFIPTTQLQRNMKNIVSKIETRINQGCTESFNVLPKRISLRQKT